MRTAGPGPGRGRLLRVATATGILLVALPLPTATADDATQCTFPSKMYAGRPWSLQRVLMDELWKQSTGKGYGWPSSTPAST